MVVAIAIISCSQDNEQLLTEANSIENLAKSSNEVSALYFDLLANHFQNPEAFNELSLETKIDLYEYKYDRFLNENDLTSDQIQAIDGLKVFVKNLEFDSELELSNDKVTSVWSNFDFEQGAFLLFHLGNSSGDYESSIQSDEVSRCWWCWRRVITNPCHEEFVDGESIGFYQTEQMQRHGLFGIRNSSRDKDAVLMPCGS